MTRKEQIINELEKVHGVELDANFDAGANGLCEDIHCPNPECSCWQEFTQEIQSQLSKQVVYQ